MAVIDLPRIAEENDWQLDMDNAAPDWFGDCRIKAFGVGGVVTMVFNDCGKMVGGYMAARDGTLWHSERVTDVARWLREWNGDVYDG